MPQHHNERRAEKLHGVFETGESVVIEEISGEADHEDVTRTLIEHELGRDSAVGAAQHCNDGVLHDRSFGAASREVLFVGCVRHVTGVALH